jgi:hypothetical protein
MTGVNNTLSSREVLERFPEINEIDDPDISILTTSALQQLCPEYFWKVPGSSSGKYHPEDHRKEMGLWLHTKRAFTQFERLSSSYLEQGKITEEERDYGRSAILLHDIYKYGLPKEKHTVRDHDVIAAQELRDFGGVPEEIVGCVESHNGPWYAGREPRTDLEQVHHLADMSASDVNNPSIAILEPCEKLEKNFPNVNTR